MIGQAVLRECLADPEVERVLSIARTPGPVYHTKHTELVHADFTELASISAALAGYHACLFCLGVSSAGMTEAQYRAITYDVTLAAAHALVRENPAMTFIYVSGAGTNAHKKTMWARVKGQTENALMQLPFKAAYMFRPAYIQPMHGAVSKTKSYRVMYAVAAPLYPVWRTLFPRHVTTTEKVGRAMLKVAKQGAPKKVLENADINALAA